MKDTEQIAEVVFDRRAGHGQTIAGVQGKGGFGP
jgi:hypothetical protein